MSHMFREIDRETLFLLPPSMEDWLPEGHLAHFIVEIVAQLDLTSLKAAYAGRGSKAHHPEMLRMVILPLGYRRARILAIPPKKEWPSRCFGWALHV